MIRALGAQRLALLLTVKLVGSSWVVVAGGLTGVDFIPHGIKHGTESTHTSPYRPYFTTYFINLIERAS